MLVLVIVSVAISLQSCFEIRERVKLNKDGSGTFSLIIDMSEMKAMMESFSGEDSDESKSPLANIEDQFSTTRDKLEEIDGISNITMVTENSGYVVTTGFDFSNIEALNKAMNVVYEDDNESGEITEYYRLKRKKFERTAAHNMLEQVKEEVASNEMQAQGMDPSTLFADVAYVNEVVYSGRKVRKTSNDDIVVAEDGMSMTLTRYVFRKDENLAMDYTVKLK